MPDPISAVRSIPSIETTAIKPQGKSGEFGALLDGTIQTLQSAQSSSADAIQKFLTGESEELHSTVLAAQKAEIAFDLALQVRNKVVSAYQEIMRMQM